MADTQSNVRIESFPCADPADIQVHLALGEVLVELVDTDVVTVAISLGASAPRNGLGERLGLVREAGADAVAEAIHKVTTHFTRGRLVVQVPNRRLTPVPLRVVVRARVGSKLHFTGGDARFTVTGQARSLSAEWNSGTLMAENIDGPCKVRTSNGRIKLGTTTGSIDVRAGEATLDIQHIAGSGAQLTTGSGSVTLGTVESDVSLTTGAGSIAVADAVAGHLQVRTGPGSIRVGVREGISAQVDLSSRRGSARNDIPASAGAAPLRISAASTSGDIVVTRAG